MAKRNQSIQFFEHDKDVLIKLYLARRIPIDQYEVRQSELRDLTTEFSNLTRINITPPEILRYMRNERKNGRWVRLDGNHTAAPHIPSFTPEETEALVAIYYEYVISLDTASDSLAYEPQIARIVAREFAKKTGRHMPARFLIGRLTKLRKRGLLPKVGNRPKKEDLGFSDIDEVG